MSSLFLFIREIYMREMTYTERLNYSLQMLKGRFARIEKDFNEGKNVDVKKYVDIHDKAEELLFSADTLLPIATQQCSDYPYVMNRNSLQFLMAFKNDVVSLLKDIEELKNQFNKNY